MRLAWVLLFIALVIIACILAAELAAGARGARRVRAAACRRKFGEFRNFRGGGGAAFSDVARAAHETHSVEHGGAVGYPLHHAGADYPEPKLRDAPGATGGAPSRRFAPSRANKFAPPSRPNKFAAYSAHRPQVHAPEPFQDGAHWQRAHFHRPLETKNALQHQPVRSGMRKAPFADEVAAPVVAAPLVAKRSAAPEPKQHWQLYQTWDALKKDPGASAEYFRARTAAINNPDFEWGAVLESLRPLLQENREHVGIIGVKRDGRTLRVVASEASPDEVGVGVAPPYFAGVPAELVSKYADRPALFFFHTHPADERASPLPSSPDLATAVYFGATARFAASVVISRYGVLVYGLSWSAYKSINGAADWKLALLNFTHDVIATNEAVRSWSFHTLPDYLQLYPRMRLTFYAHPSPPMVATGVQPAIMHSLESEVDHSLLDEYSADIARHLAGKNRRRPRGRTAAQKAVAPFEHADFIPAPHLDAAIHPIH